jgi:hypothetical protein
MNFQLIFNYCYTRLEDNAVKQFTACKLPKHVVLMTTKNE